ncbi:SAM-dependent methyltransferase [Actinophytocola sp.]|uniref:SAM-dependent methyltransferase n=1 Tax=Actinophytocola sp. TaxID=1872138 RepID=UPI002D5C2138|nr:SAM-dependent methyltransferase [Actinophytocola sp.]HYQ67458.1 SAM-dependent methyltransferase [Actinophytocola sp.]
MATIASKYDAPSKVPVGVDPNRASIARVYDAFLGGKDNYAIDREVYHRVREVAPEAQDLAWSNRNFLIRAVRFLVDQGGIRQFLDCGSGLPTAENTHQIAQRIAPEARVVYVDNDPVVIAHGNALLDENDYTHFVAADIFQPQDVLQNPQVRGYLDFREPIALLQVGTLHHYTADNGGELMQEYVDALAPGSFVAISHFLNPGTAEHQALAERMENVFIHSPMGSGRFRSKAEIMKFIPGLEIIPPGPGMAPDIVMSDMWWPDGPRLRPLSQVEECSAAVVARKPPS